MKASSTSSRVALIGVAATIVAHLVLQAQGPNTAFIVGACVFWTVFVVVRVCQDNSVLRHWGFRVDNLVQASQLPAVVFVATAAGFALYANWQGTLRFPLHAWLLLLLYPLWGLIQQFLVLGVVVNHLEQLPSWRQRKLLIVVSGAALFGLIHGFDPLLMAGTFALELVCIPLYLKDRNLWPLAVLHGWLGALFYLWVLGRDMWVENFG
jgi:hypothetical protein